jgi:hypothetical protein
LRESGPSMKFPNFLALICSVINFVTSNIQGAVDQQGWRDVKYKMMCVTLCQGRRENQFQVALREIPSLLRGSVDVCSIRHVFPHRSKCLDMWKSSKSFYLETLL